MGGGTSDNDNESIAEYQSGIESGMDNNDEVNAGADLSLNESAASGGMIVESNIKSSFRNKKSHSRGSIGLNGEGNEMQNETSSDSSSADDEDEDSDDDDDDSDDDSDYERQMRQLQEQLQQINNQLALLTKKKQNKKKKKKKQKRQQQAAAASGGSSSKLGTALNKSKNKAGLLQIQHQAANVTPKLHSPAPGCMMNKNQASADIFNTNAG